MSQCIICEEPITGPEIIVGNSSICVTCGNCSVCDKQVNIDEIRNCLAHNSPIRHNSCARVPRRRCIYLDERGQQCDIWFPAVDSNKICPTHRGIISPGSLSPENTPRYIDLVNDERKYCYHFLDGTTQAQPQKLIFEFKDDLEGTVYEKLDVHIAFLEKVIEDMKTRLHSARDVKSEKLDALSEAERVELRKIKVSKAINPERAKSFKSDPVGNLMKKQGMSKEDATDMLSLDVDALLAKFAEAKKNKESNL